MRGAWMLMIAMNFSISACKASHWRANAFERLVRGPGIEHFNDRNFGAAVRMFFIILETQSPQKTLKHHPRYFPEQRCFYCHFVLEDEALDKTADEEASQAIASTILAALTKALRKLKNHDFDSARFVSELSSYFDEAITKGGARGV